VPDTDIDDEICTVKVLREGGGGMRTCLVAGAACLLVSGCVTTPQFETLSGVTPKTIVDVIECELIEAREKIRNANKRLDKKKQPTLDEWTAVADLTLQVDEDASLAPAFAHTDVVSKSLTRAFDWGVKFNTQATRIYTETVTFKIADLKTCRRPATRLSLNGNLGLDETIAMAFGTIDLDDVGIGHPGDPVTKSTRRAREPFVGFSEKGYALSRKGKGRREEKGKKENAFSTSIEFVVVKSLGPAGPTWSLSNFRGPGKLFSVERGDAHKLRISFARGPDAEREGSNQNLKLLLESPSPRFRQLP